MLLRELQYIITQQWQRWADLDVYINTGDELRPLVDTDVSLEDNRFVLIPEAKKVTVLKNINIAGMDFAEVHISSCNPDAKLKEDEDSKA